MRVNAKPFVVDSVNIRLFSHSRMIWTWYSIDGIFTANPSLAKLLQLKRVLLKGPHPEASITLWIDYTGKQEVAAVDAAGFSGQHYFAITADEPFPFGSSPFFSSSTQCASTKRL